MLAPTLNSPNFNYTQIVLLFVRDHSRFSRFILYLLYLRLPEDAVKYAGVRPCLLTFLFPVEQSCSRWSNGGQNARLKRQDWSPGPGELFFPTRPALAVL